MTWVLPEDKGTIGVLPLAQQVNGSAGVDMLAKGFGGLLAKVSQELRESRVQLLICYFMLQVSRLLTSPVDQTLSAHQQLCQEQDIKVSLTYNIPSESLLVSCDSKNLC